jgi:hypothetical protein
MIAFEGQIFPIVRTLPIRLAEAFDHADRFIAAVITYLAKESDLNWCALPATRAEEVGIEDGVRFDLPYRGPAIQEVPFFHIFLPFARRLIHNQVLKFDRDERLARGIALCADDVALHYLHHLRAYLLRILARDSTFVAPGIFEATEKETLEGQLSLFRTFAGIDDSDTLTFLFSRHAEFTYTMSRFWEHARPIPISFWQWYFIVEVGHAYRHNCLFADNVIVGAAEAADPALLFGFALAQSPAQKYLDRLVQSNVDCDYDNVIAHAPERPPDIKLHEITRLGNLEIAANAIKSGVAHAHLSFATKPFGGAMPVAFRCDDALALFWDIRPDPPADLDPFEFSGCLITDIFNAFGNPDTLLSDRASQFRAWFVSPRGHSLLADQIFRLLATRQPHHFNNILHLLDPYRSPGEWKHAYLLFVRIQRKLTEAAMLKPTAADIDGLLSSCPCVDLLNDFKAAHVFDDYRLLLGTFSNWVMGLGGRIYEWNLLGPPLTLAALLQAFNVLLDFPFMDSLVRLLWHVRATFRRSPALFGAVLSCCSLFDDSDLPVLQCLPFARDFEKLTIPRTFTAAASAFDQKQDLIRRFLEAYHPVVDTFVSFGWPIERRTPGQLMLHSFITFESLRATLTAIAVEAIDDSMKPDDCLKRFVTSHPCPLCKFDLAEEGFFGYSDADWANAFGTVPCFWKWDNNQWATPAREQWKPRRRRLADRAYRCAPLVCIAWIYAPPGQFNLTDFCTDAPIETFVRDEDPKVTFLARPTPRAGPLARFIPNDVRKLIFDEYVGT